MAAHFIMVCALSQRRSLASAQTCSSDLPSSRAHSGRCRNDGTPSWLVRAASNRSERVSAASNKAASCSYTAYDHECSSSTLGTLERCQRPLLVRSSSLQLVLNAPSAEGECPVVWNVIQTHKRSRNMCNTKSGRLPVHLGLDHAARLDHGARSSHSATAMSGFRFHHRCRNSQFHRIRQTVSVAASDVRKTF